MSETFWDAGAAVRTEPDGNTPEDSEARPQIEGSTPAEPVNNSRSLSLSADEFAGLEARVLRAVSLMKQERQARAAAEDRAARAEAALIDEAKRGERMQAEINALKGEREDVKTRVDRLLEQLDALEQ